MLPNRLCDCATCISGDLLSFVITSLQVSRDGSQFVMVCGDKRLRVFRFQAGKLRRVYNESLEVRQDMKCLEYDKIGICVI
jgi:hypothetical protein